MASPSYQKGDEVFVFYRMNKRCMPQRKYLAVLDQRHGAYRPRNGVSDGWVPAKVVAANKDDVQVEYAWPYFFTQRGHLADANSGWTEWYRNADVRAAAGEAHRLCAAGAPELAIITFRWGGLNEVIAPGQWGETGSSVSDIFIDSFIEMAVIPEIGNSYELWTVYIEDRNDMAKIADSAHLIFGPTHPAKRARKTCGMYHLYPTSFEENCIPSRETGEDAGAALVDQKSLFRMIQAVERAGIPTRFPHPSGFYELLTSKRWTYMMSLTPHLRVPPTVAMPRMLIEKDLAMASAKGLVALELVKKQQAVLRNEPLPTEPITKGVAKLGFSWEALDVKFWEHQAGLEQALSSLSQTIEISQEITGQPHDLEAIIVQEYCKHDLEVRLYVVEGQVEATIYTKFCKIKDNLEFGDFKELFSQQEAAAQWMGGDLAALKAGEEQCRQVTEHWMAWVQAQISDVPPAIRFDYFVGRGEKPGQAVMWTLEICELGFSMLGAKSLPAKVFRAMLRSMLERGGSASSAAEQPVAAAASSGDPAAPGTNPAPSTVEAEGEGEVPAAAPEAPQPEEEEEVADGKAAKGGEAEDPAEPGAAPPVLYIVMPRCAGATDDQQACAGKYALVPDADANAHPVWVHARGNRWLYHGNDDCWYVGDEEERDLNFDCDQGYIRHQGYGSLMPTSLSGPWERGPEWTPDLGICVSVDGSSAPATNGLKSAKGKGKNKGKGKVR